MVKNNLMIERIFKLKENGTNICLDPTLLKCNPLKAVLEAEFISVLFVLFFLDLFDAVGTVVGVAEQGGFYKNGVIVCCRWYILLVYEHLFAHAG